MEKRVAMLIAVLFLATLPSVSAQEQQVGHSHAIRIGTRVHAFTQSQQVVIGAETLIPIPGIEWLLFYPTLDFSMVGDDPTWLAQGNVRIHPLGRNGSWSFWYVGAGTVFRDDKITQGILTGVELRSVRGRPFVQISLQGPVRALGGELEFVAGLKMSLH